MQLEIVKTNNQRRDFIEFRKKLYKNDKYYVSTIEYTFKMLFKQTTKFAKACVVRPILVKDNSAILAEAILVKAPNDNFIQIAFFEALENANDAVNMIKDYSRIFAGECNVTKIIVGLYGHLSYGVGFTVNINNPNTFDSVYTKQYYVDYFKEYIQHELCAFSSKLIDLYPYMIDRKSNIVIRPINFKDFHNEMIVFRDICEKTIGKTFLYSKTEEEHFYELMKELKFFLKEDNILFAFDNDKIVGFAFWHPDYNEILRKGKIENKLSIGIKYILNKNKIKRVKLNAIGVLENYEGLVTMSLLNEVSKRVKQYEIIETNFVWKNNVKSMRINKHLLKNVEREFLVMEENV